MPSSSGSRRTASSSPASTASRSGSPKPATRGSNACGGEDGFPCPDPSRRGCARAPAADRPPPRRGIHLPEHPPGRAYSGALRRLDAWLAGRRLDDQALAAYLAELHDQGRAPASASTVVAAACFRARLTHEPSPAGERTARVLAGCWCRRPRRLAAPRTGERGFQVLDMRRRALYATYDR